jgi:hypothetical protein
MIHNLPSILIVDALPGPRCNLVANNLQRLGLLLAEHVGKQGADDGLHATTQDDNGHVVLLGPVKELFEARIEVDVLAEDVDALVQGGANAVEHLPEGIAEMATAMEHVLVALATQLRAKAQVVRHVVIAVLLSDGAVKIREEDELGICLERRKGCWGNGTHFKGCEGIKISRRPENTL